MRSTNGQSSVNGRTQGKSVGTDTVVSHVVLLSSLEGHNIGLGVNPFV